MICIKKEEDLKKKKIVLSFYCKTYLKDVILFLN